MYYNLSNTAKAPHVIYNAAGKAVVIEAGSTTKEPVVLRDDTAIALRRMESRGSALKILATDATGDAVLERAKEPPIRTKPKLYLSPDELKQSQVPKPIPIRDELADVAVVTPVEEQPVVEPRRTNRSSHRRS